MNKSLIKVFALAAVVFISLFAFADFTPFTSSPEYMTIEDGEQCQKEDGALKCRWGGECAKVGNSCASCPDGFKYSPDMGTCYDCPEGNNSLVNENGKFYCR
jgi:hypothetical protein